jgi:hypothetical protein
MRERYHLVHDEEEGLDRREYSLGAPEKDVEVTKAIEPKRR